MSAHACNCMNIAKVQNNWELGVRSVEFFRENNVFVCGKKELFLHINIENEIYCG